jgi:hypothetical protein
MEAGQEILIRRQRQMAQDLRQVGGADLAGSTTPVREVSQSNGEIGHREGLCLSMLVRDTDVDRLHHGAL